MLRERGDESRLVTSSRARYAASIFCGTSSTSMSAAHPCWAIRVPASIRPRRAAYFATIRA